MVHFLQDRSKLYYDSERTNHAQRLALLACHGVLRGTTHFLNNNVPSMIIL